MHVHYFNGNEKSPYRTIRTLIVIDVYLQTVTQTMLPFWTCDSKHSVYFKHLEYEYAYCLLGILITFYAYLLITTETLFPFWVRSMRADRNLLHNDEWIYHILIIITILDAYMQVVIHLIYSLISHECGKQYLNILKQDSTYKILSNITILDVFKHF